MPVDRADGRMRTKKSDVRLVRSVADGTLGVLKTSRLSPHCYRPTRRAAFFREAYYLSALSRLGARVPAVLDTNAAEWRRRSAELFIVTRYIEGVGLGSEGRMEAKDAFAFAVSLCDVLSVVHGLGIVHGDVGYNNALMAGGRPEEVWLVDFGRAVPMADSPKTRYGFVAGRATYDVHTDLAHVCSCLYFCLTGRWRHPKRNTPPLHRCQGHEIPCRGPVAAEINLLLDRGFSSSPDEQLRSVAELREGLQRIAATAGWECTDPPPPPPEESALPPAATWAARTSPMPWPVRETYTQLDYVLDALAAGVVAAPRILLAGLARRGGRA